MTVPTNDRREVLTALLAEYREHMFRSEFIANGEERGYVIASDIAQTVWQDMTRAVLAAQEGERGGAEVAAVAKITVDHARAEGWRVIACVCGEQWPGRDWNAHREHVEALVAGALAKHDAEVLRAAARDWPIRAMGLGGDIWLLERADRTEAGR